MERDKAKLIVKQFKKENNLRITMQDAMCMTCVMTDNEEIYAIHKENITLIAKIYRNCINTKVIRW